MLNVVTWMVDPILFEWGNVHVGWYGLLFAVGLIVFGYYIEQRMWEREKLPEGWLNALFYYVLIGTVVGARLGHCLFYHPEYYLADPIEILKVWEGGLASHGGVVGIITAVYFFSRRYSHRSMLWTLDRLVVPTGLVGGMIRLGNLMNHEIYGHATDLPWGFRFITNVPYWRAGAEPVFSVPSHPTQIYEALAYFVIFGILMWLYWRKNMQRKVGFLSGVFMILVFGVRFFVEFLKNDQAAFEADMILNMGQLLSIPCILIGIACIIYSHKCKKPAEGRII